MVARLVIAAANSSAGKTTISTGLMAAMVNRGVAVQGFKVGPDFIDPGFHALATGRPGRNLDPFLTGEESLGPLFRHGMIGADLGIVEGVMGVFDGQLGTDGFGSTAHVAKALDAPVILVLSGAHTSRTAATALLGIAAFDPDLKLAGTIINNTASLAHATELRRAVEQTGIPVLGVVGRNPAIFAPSRHLGLVPAAERQESAATITALAESVAQDVDLDAVLQLAETASEFSGPTWDPAQHVSPVPGRPRIAIAGGRAFTFRYPETVELLEAAGCEVVEFDPLTDPTLPPKTAGLYLGGGFPQVHAAELNSNWSLRADISTAISAGLPTVAECAGQLYLGLSVDGVEMIGVTQATSQMTPKLTLGYRQAIAVTDSLLCPAGTSVTGHEFHRTQTSSLTPSAWSWTARGSDVSDGVCLDPANTGRATVHSSYLHVHWAGHPELANNFAAAAANFPGFAPTIDIWMPASAPVATPLAHHGDDDARTAAPQDLNLAVNVRRRRPPKVLRKVISQTMDSLGNYPDARTTRSAIARAHGVREDQVLPTAGAAEAFTLIAHGLHPTAPTVIHPQFTEPDAALTAAGIRAHRLLLEPPFTLTETQVPSWSDVAFVGNPTNPTGVLHSAASLTGLTTANQILVVDEAFMDTTNETETLISPTMKNLLVIRSATKMWGIAGLRAGYVIGDPSLVAQLAAVQPQWSVSTPALAVLEAIASHKLRRRLLLDRKTIEVQRAYLLNELEKIGFPANPSLAPFVLVKTPWPDAWDRLKSRGVIVRRCDTFPGLDSSWIRIAVCPPAQTDRLLAAVRNA